MKNALKITSLSSIELYKRDFQLTESDGQNWSPKSLKHPQTIQSYLLKMHNVRKAAKSTLEYLIIVYVRINESFHSPVEHSN